MHETRGRRAAHPRRAACALHPRRTGQPSPAVQPSPAPLSRLGWLLAVLVVGAGCDARDRAAVGDPWTALEGWPEHQEEAIRVAGVVEARDLEGGIWIIRAPDGAEWAPLELPQPFRVEGAGVVTDVRLRPDLLSIGMAGTLVEILRIRHGSVPGMSGGAVAGDEGSTHPGTENGGVPELLGEWRIGATHRPGATGGAAGTAWWDGRTIRYGPGFVVGPAAECGGADYERRRVAGDALLSGRFGVPPASLPPLAAVDAVDLIEVRCEGAGWDALGATVLLVGDGAALVAWQGAFLELEPVR